MGRTTIWRGRFPRTGSEKRLLDQDPDESAIREILAGNPDAFGEIVNRHQSSLQRTLVGLVGDLHLADDVAQDVWWLAYRSLDRFRFESRFRTWLFRIAIREALSARTKARRILSRSRTMDEPADAPRSSYAEKEEVRELLARLPASERAAFVMHAEGFRYEEIAAALSCPAGTVATRIHRARQRLGRVVGASSSQMSERPRVRSAEAES